MARVIVYHSAYGCDTGCCGHTVEMTEGDAEMRDRSFQFSHPYDEDPIEFARDLVRQVYGEHHVADLDWDECRIIDD